MVAPPLHHYNPRQYLYTPDPKDLPIPIEFIDVGRRTETNLEDQSEAFIEDVWYASDPRYLTAPWTGRTIFPLRHLKPPKNMEYCNGEFIMIFTDTLRLAEISDYSEIVKFAEELEELI